MANQSQGKLHGELVAAILIELSKLQYNCRVWKNATGTALSMDGRRVIKFGLPGASDILGIKWPGQFIAIEVKTGSGKQNPDQVAFQKMVESLGGVYVLARNIDDCIKAFVN